jgi:hypothetical protein
MDEALMEPILAELIRKANVLPEGIETLGDRVRHLIERYLNAGLKPGLMQGNMGKLILLAVIDRLIDDDSVLSVIEDLLKLPLQWSAPMLFSAKDDPIDFEEAIGIIKANVLAESGRQAYDRLKRLDPLLERYFRHHSRTHTGLHTVSVASPSIKNFER